MAWVEAASGHALGSRRQVRLGVRHPSEDRRQEGRERLFGPPSFRISPAERAECTFVFVTPRNWKGKTDWAKGKNANGDWKAVRAFDASDLEQWLEESIPAQMWLAEQLGLQVSGFETLDQCWRRWEDASDPKMTPALFEPSIIAYRDELQAVARKAKRKQFVVAADSRDEALAFLSCLFQDEHHPIALKRPCGSVQVG